MLNLATLIAPERIRDLKGATKEEALEELIALVAESPLVTDPQELRRRILEREKSCSTGIGRGVALPHVKTPAAKDFVIAVGRHLTGVDFNAEDNRPVYIVVLVCCNDSQAGEMLKLMGRLVKNFRDKDFTRRLLLAKNTDEVRDMLAAL